MELNYYVLGKKNNEMLKGYNEKYYNILYSKIKFLISQGYIDKDYDKKIINFEKTFILNPDVASLINYIHSQSMWWFLSFEDDNVKLLNKEFYNYDQWNFDNLTMNKWDKITWTDIRLTALDNNPYADYDAHPDHAKEGVWIWWWNLSKDKWFETYEKVYSLLKELDEWIFDELNFMINKIIPLSTSKYKHNSASYKECVWHLYMWYTLNSPIPELPILEALIHESSHNKLNLINQVKTFMYNNYAHEYYSPYRPDARHIHGVFLWVHAFAPTVYVLLSAYEKWYIWNDKSWLEKLLLYHMKNKYAISVLSRYGDFSSIWKEIMQEIKYVIWLSDNIISKLNIDIRLNKNVKEKFKIHLQDVKTKYKWLKY